MTYKETTEYLFNSTPVFEKVGASAYKEGLQTTLALDQHFGHPHRSFRTIHVAGTNGKGSTSHTLAAVLQNMGLKVGLYTSPHIVDFRERIRVNGLCISEQYVVDFVEKERNFFEPLHPSFFELTTAMAFKYFAEQEVDVAVIEVGLGGRLDCTNIIHPILSVITNISFDHIQFLGNTLGSIANEKAGIIKPSTPVVIGESNAETRAVFELKAQEMSAAIVFAEDEPEVLECTYSDGMMQYSTRSFGKVSGALAGDYQKKNANTIFTAIKILRTCGINPDIRDIKDGFASVCKMTGLVGRWQTLQDAPLVICDTGHNLAGWLYLSRQINETARTVNAKTLRIVFGMVDDKDISSVMDLLPKNAQYYLCQASTKRAVKEERIAELADSHGLNNRHFPNVADAYKAALSDASCDDFVFVGGSSYVVADLLTAMQKENF